ncbi:MAG: enolase C-terminal domain-like protein [Promethearchaeota archaeon]
MFEEFDAGNLLFDDIRSISINMVNIKFIEDFTISGGTSGKNFMPIVIQVKDSRGNAGISTLDNFPTSAYDRNGTLVSWVALKEDYIPSLISFIQREGRFSIFKIQEFLHGIRDFNPFAVSAIEMAFWDLLGKKLGRPCHQLFNDIFQGIVSQNGGLIDSNERNIRDERLRLGLESKISIGIKPRYYKYDSVIMQCMKHGINTFKFKISPNPRENVGLLEYIRDTYPDIIIDTDANSSFKPYYDTLGNTDAGEIISVYKSMEKYNPRMHEQPSIFTGNHLEIFKNIQQQLETPLCPDESVHGLHEVIKFCGIAKELSRPFFLNIKIHRMGGIFESIRALSYIYLHNQENPGCKIIPWGGYMPDQQPSTSALIQLFSLPIETSHTDATLHQYWFRDSIFNEETKVNGGRVNVDTINDPGLGVSINHDKMFRLQIRKKEFHVQWQA